jgi:hypothetical protein
VIYERPSRASRALVALSSLLVVIFAGWMLTPIVLAHYPSAVAAVPLLRDLIGQDGAPEPQSVAAPTPETSRAREVATQAEPALVTALESAPVTEAQPAPVDTAAEPMPPSSPAPAASIQISAQASADLPAAPTAPPGLLPWPEADSSTAPVEPEAAEVTTGTLGDEPVAAAQVPLPRPRPSAAAVARLTVPVPRPRPDEAPAAEEERALPDDGLFDRLTRPN